MVRCFYIPERKVNPATDFVGFSVCPGLGTDLSLCQFSVAVVEIYAQKKPWRNSPGNDFWNQVALCPMLEICTYSMHIHTIYNAENNPKEGKISFIKFLFLRVILKYMSSDEIKTNHVIPNIVYSTVNWEKIHKVLCFVWTGISQASNRTNSTSNIYVWLTLKFMIGTSLLYSFVQSHYP